MSPTQIHRLLEHGDSWLSCAYVDDKLAGYCIAIRLHTPLGLVAWITQLVVRAIYRQGRVATQMLYSIWQFTDCYAWGLATANPYAVRALETATRRPCRQQLIRNQGSDLLRYLSAAVDYLPEELAIDAQGHPQPRVNTEFFVSHAELPEMRRLAGRGERPWDLGDISEGEEWFACTFSSQQPTTITDEHLTELLVGSDHIWIHAYEGMTLDARHAWNKHAEVEVDAISAWSSLEPDAQVLDIGCGNGRHTAALARRGFAAFGVDISATLIERAREVHHELRDHFGVADCRDADQLPPGPFQLALCLYDVIGSSAFIAHDEAMLRAIVSRLAPGGHLVVTVLNADATLHRLAPEARPQTMPEFINALEKLPPSHTMERTGDIFDPGFLVYYDGIHYRKEQFDLASWRLPSEVVVRDRRYDQDGLRELLKRCGANVVSIRPVQAGHWDRDPPLGNDDIRAKELLAVARRP